MPEPATPGRDEAIATLNRMIEGIETAMLTTAEPDGTLRSRPMAAQRFPFDGTLWFFTQADAPKVDEVQQDRHVNVTFADPGRRRFVSLSGHARLVHDRAAAERLWNPNAKAWFPGGLDDPNLGLLRVTVHKAEYWDAPDDAVDMLKSYALALVSGAPYQPGDNAKVDLGGR